jgi:hypothetical protein
MTPASAGTWLAPALGMLAKLATALGLLLVLGGVFACGPKSQHAVATTAAVLLCYPETLQGGTLVEAAPVSITGEPTGPDSGDDTEVVPEALLGPEPFATEPR